MQFADAALDGTHPGSYSSYNELKALVENWKEGNELIEKSRWEFTTDQ